MNFQIETFGTSYGQRLIVRATDGVWSDRIALLKGYSRWETLSGTYFAKDKTSAIAKAKRILTARYEKEQAEWALGAEEQERNLGL